MTVTRPPELAEQCVRDELLALNADLGSLSPRGRRLATSAIARNAAVNGDDRPREAADAHTHQGGTPREHDGRY